jgi:uncharacterized protein (TIGR00369 family)
MTEELLLFGQQALAAQPFSALLGAQLTAYAAWYAEITLTLKPEYTQHMGVAHGGIVSYAADTASPLLGAQCWELLRERLSSPLSTKSIM